MNNTPKAKIFISCRDKAGIVQRRHPTAWSRVTGKDPASIRRHWKQAKLNGRSLTPRQIVGYDTVEKLRPPLRPPKLDVGDVLGNFLRKRLI